MKTTVLMTLLLATQLSHAADSDTAQCDRAADPMHPGNPPGVTGEESTPNYDEDSAAWDALRLACENSYAAHPDTPRYAYQLARLYYTRDYSVSGQKYLKTAAEQGDPVAQNTYGNTLNEQSYDGTDWLKKAAAQGYIPAMESLGDYYSRTNDDNPDENHADPAQAHEWYEKAAAAGNASAAYKLGEILRPDAPEQAHDWYQKAAAGGELHAALPLGDYYRERDPDKARTYYEAATSLREPEAYYKLAELLRTSEPAVARAWYRKAALGGYDTNDSAGKAATALGDIYRHGENVPQNLTEAYAWYIRSGSVPALLALASMHENGEGVEADPQLAREYYNRISENYEYQIPPVPENTTAVALAYQKHADLADADTPAEERKADYRQSLRLGNDAAIEKLRALGETPYDINQILNERRQLRGD